MVKFTWALPQAACLFQPGRTGGNFQNRQERSAVVVHAEDETMIRRGRRDCECARGNRNRETAKVGNRLHCASRLQV